MSSCNKHEILYDTTKVADEDAELQIHYVAPINNVASNYIDSVFANGKLIASVEGSSQLKPYNGIPSGSAGRFYTIKSGKVELQFYQSGSVVYDKTLTLSSGKQDIFVYDLAKDPLIMKNGYPYKDNSASQTTVGTFGTDSLTYIRFYNFLFEDVNTPYPGKLKYQYKNPRTKEWEDVGDYVGFGEVTAVTPLLVIKDVYNSSGYCYEYYRILDEDGNILRVWSSGSRYKNYSDYWRAYIGRVCSHIYCGTRTESPKQGVKLWYNQ
jgi:hypothetical protein